METDLRAPEIGSIVDRPRLTANWQQFLRVDVLRTLRTGKAIEIVTDEPTAMMKRLRSLFSYYQMGTRYHLHIKVEDDRVLVWVSLRRM